VANFFGGLGNTVYVGSGGGAFYQNYQFSARIFTNSTTPFFSKSLAVDRTSYCRLN
jgi:hypothetical protein